MKARHGKLRAHRFPCDPPVRCGTTTCRIEQAGLMAKCRIGKGFVLIVADAALLEPASGAEAEARAHALRMLMQQAFAR